MRVLCAECGEFLEKPVAENMPRSERIKLGSPEMVNGHLQMDVMTCINCMNEAEERGKVEALASLDSLRLKPTTH